MNDVRALDLRGARRFDGVRLAILNKRFESIVRKMANTLLRTGRSGVLNTARDFSCCIVTAANELVTAAECYPIHVLRGADLMCAAMQQFHPKLRRGDAFCTIRPITAIPTPPTTPFLFPLSTRRARTASRCWSRLIRPTAATRSRRPIWVPPATSMTRAR